MFATPGTGWPRARVMFLFPSVRVVMKIPVLFGRDPILRPLRFLRLRLPLGYLRLPVCAGPCGFRGPARVARSIVGRRPRR